MEFHIGSEKYSAGISLSKSSDNLSSRYKCDEYFHGELDNLSCVELPLHTLLTIEANYSKYQPLQFVDISRSNDNELSLLFEISFDMRKWSEKINIMSFRELFIDESNGENVLVYDHDDFYESRLTTKLIYREVFTNESVSTLIYKYLNEFLKIQSKILEEHSSLIDIIKESEIPEEYQASSTSLLHYFSTIVKQKFPDITISLSIKNTKEAVKVTISCPEESREKVDNVFSQYGLVLSGKKDIQEFLDNPHQIMALEHKLSIAELELRHAQDRLSFERSNFEGRISQLEDSTETYKKLLGDMMTRDNQIRDDFKSIIKNTTRSNNLYAKNTLNFLASSIEEKNKDKVSNTLAEIKEKDPTLFDQVNDIILKGAVSGASGNILYQWLLPIINTFPK